MPEYIHGSSDPREVARLEKQARFSGPMILADFEAPPGSQVLDLATGVGAMAGLLLQRYPAIHLTGIDLRLTQLRQALRNHPGPGYAQADGTRLPFRDQTFDRVHCSWMLEHVPDPTSVLKEVRRVLKPGGYCHFTEVDNASFRTTPEFPEVVEAMDALNTAQQQGGGDPFIGRRLEALFHTAGFSEIAVRPAPLQGSHADLAFFQGFAEEFAEIFESIDEALGPHQTSKLLAAAKRLRELPELPGAQMFYRAFIGQAWR